MEEGRRDTTGPGPSGACQVCLPGPTSTSPWSQCVCRRLLNLWGNGWVVPTVLFVDDVRSRSPRFPSGPQDHPRGWCPGLPPTDVLRPETPRAPPRPPVWGAGGPSRREYGRDAGEDGEDEEEADWSPRPNDGPDPSVGPHTGLVESGLDTHLRVSWTLALTSSLVHSHQPGPRTPSLVGRTRSGTTSTVEDGPEGSEDPPDPDPGNSPGLCGGSNGSKQNSYSREG